LYKKLLNKRDIGLIEPFVDISINCPNKYVNIIMNNAVKKRSGKVGEVISNSSREESNFKI